jgi:crotonobetainyl-CoA:carnitine CoA-transferase CaiB-like acyl-CoA transferase
MTKALAGVRVLDFTWLFAGAWGPRYLAAYGAEVIKIEWHEKMDFMRYNPPLLSKEGEAPLEVGMVGTNRPEDLPSPNRSGYFHDINTGKRGISLNLHHPEGRALFRRLIAVSDVICDNFTATTMDRWGFGYEVMQSIRPDIIYVQAPGFGKHGLYRDYRSYGPIAQGVGGLTYQGGLPDRSPCGWGFSYLDVTSAWYLAMAALTALRFRKRTGLGQHVDHSQVDCAIYHTGTALLDYSVNGRQYERTGNRSPHVHAAPHGAYRCEGWDNWIAIGCSTEAHWQGLVEAMGRPAWTREDRFATLEKRVANQDALDACLTEWTITQDYYALMDTLQAYGVPATAVQTSQDRVERDPQLRHRGFFVETVQSEIGSQPVEQVPGKFSVTPPHPGGPHGRGAPSYGEDNAYVYGDVLGLTAREIAELREEGAI